MVISEEEKLQHTHGVTMKKTYPDSQSLGRLNHVEGDSCDAINTCYTRLGLNVTSRWHINQNIYIFCRTFIRIADLNLTSEKNQTIFEKI